MKHSVQHRHLRIYHATAQITIAHGHLVTQKYVDLALTIASIAGLLSAAAFLITMS